MFAIKQSRSITTVTCFILLLVFLSFCDTKQTNKQPEYVLKLGHQANEKDIWHRSTLYFSKIVNERSDGRIEVRIYPSEQLGKERDLIRCIKAGIVDMTTTGETMQNWASITAFCAMPYLIRDSDHLKKVAGGDIGQLISQEVIEKIGLRPLAYFQRGARNLTSNRPIKHPDDLNGIILRVPNVPVFVNTWYALGAKPTPMTFSEVFTALQQGTVEAQENPYSLINSAGFYEVQQYVDLTEHVIGWVYVVIGEKQFQAMPLDVQELILRAGEDMQEYHQQLFQEEEKELRKTLEDQGMEFIQVDKEAFRSKARTSVVSSLGEKELAIYEAIEKIQ